MKLVFLYPYALAAIPVIIVAGIVLYVCSRWVRRRKLSMFTTFEDTDAMLHSGEERRRMFRHALVLVGLCFLVVTLARPMTGPKPGSANREGIDVLLAVDISKSMLATDMQPYRLEVVRKAIHGWVDQLHGDRVGLIFFAGDAFMQIPLTNDLVSVGKLLDAARPSIIRAGGSNLELGIQTAVDAYVRDKGSSRAVILFSDGENLEGDPVKVAGDAFRTHKIRVFTVGVGTTEGALVPQKFNDKGKPDGAVRNEYGAPVRTRINPITLRAIASAGGGAYYSLADNPNALLDLHKVHLTKLVKETRSINADDYDDWFQIPVLIGLLLLFLEPLLQNLRARQVSRQTTGKTMRKTPKAARTASLAAVAVTGFALGQVATPSASAADDLRLKIRVDQHEIASGQAAKAVENLRARAEAQPNDALALYNYGVGLYAAGKYREAGAIFEEVSNMPDTELRAKALFQLANSGVRTGEAMVAKNEYAAGTFEFERALGVYDQLVKEDKRARKNLDAAEGTYLGLLERLADNSIKAANESKSVVQERDNLQKAIGALEKVMERQPEHKSAKPKLESVKKKLAENFLKEAKEKRAQAEKAMPEVQKTEDQKQLAKKLEQLNKTMQEAVSSAEEAVNTDSKNKEAQEFLTDTQKRFSEMLTEQAKKQVDEAEKDKKGQLPKFEKAMATAEQAVAQNEQNQEAKDILQKAKDGAEKAAVEDGDKLANAAEKEKTATQKSLTLNQAINKFEKALEINPENKHAENMAKNLQPKLADALTQMAKDELAQAEKAAGQSASKPPSAPGEQQPSAPKPSMAAMRESLDHLSKADQALAQAQAFGQQEAQLQPTRDQVAALSEELQKQMDAANLAAAAEGMETPPSDQTLSPGEQPPGQPTQPGQQATPPNKKAKTFADIRNVTSGGKDGFVKDW